MTALNLTVFVVDDDPAARESLTFLLRTEGFTSRAYPSATAFLAQLDPSHRGCVITDVRMPDMDGVSLAEHLRDHARHMPVVVVTGHADIPLAVKAMRAGVVDFIEKPFEGDAMVKVVRQCLEAAVRADANESERAGIERRLRSLTERESQVMTLVTEGASNKEIANTLAISPRTVEIHRANVMSKMQADSLSALVRMVLTKTTAYS